MIDSQQVKNEQDKEGVEVLVVFKYNSGPGTYSLLNSHHGVRVFTYPDVDVRIGNAPEIPFYMEWEVADRHLRNHPDQHLPCFVKFKSAEKAFRECPFAYFTTSDKDLPLYLEAMMDFTVTGPHPDHNG